MDKISDGRIDVADDNEPAGHISASGEELDRGEVQNHDEAPVGNRLHHRPFPASGRLLWLLYFLHSVPLGLLWWCWYYPVADTSASAQPFNTTFFNQPV